MLICGMHQVMHYNNAGSVFIPQQEVCDVTVLREISTHTYTTHTLHWNQKSGVWTVTAYRIWA